MSMSDPLADMFSRIMNGQAAGKTELTLPGSRLKASVCKVLHDEGYIDGYALIKEGNKSILNINLKYYKGLPVIEHLSRVSKPSRRIYRGSQDLPKVLGGLGVAIVTTSKGVMTDRAAREQGYGGEVVCVVS
jgi:small subunit ribosomal protein S8